MENYDGLLTEAMVEARNRIMQRAIDVAKEEVVKNISSMRNKYYIESMTLAKERDRRISKTKCKAAEEIRGRVIRVFDDLSGVPLNNDSEN